MVIFAAQANIIFLIGLNKFSIEEKWCHLEKVGMVLKRLIPLSCLIHFGLLIISCHCNITTRVLIWLQELLYRGHCQRYETLQNFFHSSFNFDKTKYFFHFIDMPSIKQQIARLKNAKFTLVKYFKKQKLEQN